jgi:dipeptidyl-peptidase-4
MIARRYLVAAGLGLVFAVTPLRAQEKTTFKDLNEALSAGRAMAGRSGPRSVNWIEGGRRFSFTIASDSGEQIRALDPVTGKDTLLFAARDLSFPDTAAPFQYQSFQWARDSKHLVFQARFRPIYRNSGTADYFVYSLADGTMRLAAKGARTAELSPDGAMLGYERDGDLWANDLGRKQEKRLTTGATEKIHNGRFDWVYEEEFGMAQAWNWSPDSRYLAYWQIDESPEPVVQFTPYAGSHEEWTRIPYPQVGDSNARVRLGVVKAKGGKTVWLDPKETGEYYIPRIYWTSRPDTLAVITLNRAQNSMKLFFFDVRNGGHRLVMSETSSSWIDVYDFFAGIENLMSFPEGRQEFLWISDRSGWQHIYRYDYSGRLLNQVTTGDWSVTRIEGTDARQGAIYFTSTEVSPLERQLYRVGFDGSGKTRLTQTDGTHSIDMSPDTRYYIDRWSATNQPRQVEVWATGDRMLQKLEDNAGVTRWLATHAYSPAEIFSFTTPDGVRLDGSIIKPPGFDPSRRYPVIFSIYGGPGSQQVYNSFGTSGFSQWLAQQGYLVVGLNNRGSNNYGSAFMKVVYRQLGKWESYDFAEAATYLKTLPYVDGEHIGIMGTSYGGYATLYTLATYPEIFSVGIANSSVTDWRFYDTIFTERYMGLLGENAAGYDSSAVMPRVGNISGRLLLIHSMMDDNVHPRNTMQLLTALADAGIDADLRIYPPGGHGAAYNLESFRLLQQVSDEFLHRHLKGGAQDATIQP